MARSNHGIIGVGLLLLSLLGAPPAAAAWFTKITPENEVNLGRQAAKQIERTIPLSRDPAMQARVTRVGQALLAGQEAKPFTYQFKVLAVKDINAFCLPGGYIYIYEGLLNKLPDDNALAFVLGHEMAHAAHRDYAHTQEKMESVTFLGVLASALAKDRNGDIANLAINLTALRYSRKDEYDADATALDYIWRAGFDLSGGSKVMDCFLQLQEGRKSSPKFLLTHPPPQDRQARIKEKSALLVSQPRPASPSLAAAAPTDLSQIIGDISSYAITYNSWFPLAPGNEWRYQVKGGGGATAEYTVRVLGALATPSGPVHRLAVDLDKKVSVPYQMLTTAGAVYRRNRPGLPASVWQAEYVTDFSGEIAAPAGAGQLLDQAPILLPCGQFTQVLHISKPGNSPQQSEELWLVAGVGLAKRICSSSGLEETLISYHVAPPPAVLPSEPEREALPPAAEPSAPPETGEENYETF